MTCASRRVKEHSEVRDEIKRLSGRKIALHGNTVHITDELGREGGRKRERERDRERERERDREVSL